MFATPFRTHGPQRIRLDRSEIVRHPGLRRSLVQRLIWSKKATSSLTVHQRARNPLQPATCIASIGLQVEVRLKVGLVQDWVGYFDEVDPGNAFTAMVAVEHVSATPVPADVTPPRMNLFSIAGQRDQALLIGSVSGNGGLPGLLLFDDERVSRLGSIAIAGVLLVGNCLVSLRLERRMLRSRRSGDSLEGTPGACRIKVSGSGWANLLAPGTQPPTQCAHEASFQPPCSAQDAVRLRRS